MNKVIIMSTLSALLNFFGCSSGPQKAVENTSATTQKAADNNTTQSNPSDASAEPTEPSGNTFDLATETQFYYKFQNNEKAEDYERAAKIVRDTQNESDQITPSSKRFAGWFLIEIDPPKPEFFALDEPTPKKPTYIVDLEHNKVVAANNFEDARPLIERALTLYDATENQRKRTGLLQGICEVISTIGDGDMTIIGTGNSEHEPSIKKESGLTIVKYYRRIGSMYPMYEDVTFKYYDDGTMTFEKSEPHP